jgi:hypothetical protein
LQRGSLLLYRGWPLAVSARQPAIRKRPRTFRQGLKAARQGERGRAVLRILFRSLLLSGAMVMSAAAENAPAARRKRTSDLYGAKDPQGSKQYLASRALAATGKVIS